MKARKCVGTNNKLIAMPLAALRTAIVLGLAGAALPAAAEYTILDTNGLKLNAGVTMVLGAIGTDDVAPLTNRDAYYEGFVKPNLNWTYDLKEQGTIYGKVSGFAVGQGGDGDPAGFTNGDKGARLRLEEAFLGWRGDTIDFSAGRQEFSVGDQFLIGDGDFDSNLVGEVDGSYWVAPKKAFDATAILRVNAGSMHADLFSIQADRHHGFTRLNGLNAEYLIGEGGAGGKIGAMIASISSASQLINLAIGNPTTRQGMEIYDIRANGVAIPMVPGLKVHSEFALERGEDTDFNTKFRGWAGYAEGEYNLASVVWTPTISYRYGVWSGDKNGTADGKQGAFDSLFFYNGPRGWGTWYQGEITGEYHIFNTNLRTHMVKLAVHPLETLTLTGLYFNHNLDKATSPFATIVPVTSHRWIDEVNLIAEWTPIPSVYIAGVAAWGFTGKAYEQAFANAANITASNPLGLQTKDPAVYEVWMQYTY